VLTKLKKAKKPLQASPCEYEDLILDIAVRLMAPAGFESEMVFDR